MLLPHQRIFFTELYLTLKWSKVCYFFYLWIAAYVVFVLSLSVYVTLMAHNYVGIDGIMAASRWILIVSATCLLVHGILQCCLTHGNHFRKYEMWLNLACTSLSLIVAIVEDRARNGAQSEWIPTEKIKHLVVLLRVMIFLIRCANTTTGLIPQFTIFHKIKQLVFVELKLCKTC
jgi:hypothetical protein